MTVTYIDIAMGSGHLVNWIEPTKCALPVWLLSLPSWCWPFFVPDFCAPSQSLWQWVTLFFAHFGLGAFLGLMPFRFALGVFSIWIAKEGLADLSIADWPWEVALDSVVDLSAGALGFVAMQRRAQNALS